MIFPVLGNILPPIYVVSLLFKRDRNSPINPELRGFTVLCAVYTIYIGVRALTAGSLSSAVEPTGDAASLLITSALATWACRTRMRICPQAMFKGLVIMLFCVFFLTALERFIFGESRPALIMGNPLNLTPLLLIPAVLCTFPTLAGSRVWSVLGLIAFALAVVVIGGISVTRGPLLVLVALTFVRVGFVLAERKHPVARLKVSGGILLALFVGIGISLSDSSTLSRYMDVLSFHHTERVQSETEQQDGSVAANVDKQAGSMEVRAALLRAGWAAFLDRPLVGFGPQYRFDAAARYLPDGSTLNYSHLHNDFLTHAVAGGLPAVLLLCLILMSPAIAAWRFASHGSHIRQIGLLFSISFAGTAAVNNVLFVDVSAFALGMSCVASFLILDAMSSDSRMEPSNATNRVKS